MINLIYFHVCGWIPFNAYSSQPWQAET